MYFGAGSAAVSSVCLSVSLSFSCCFLLLEESPKLGLELNPAKCEWSWLNPDCTQPCPIRIPGNESEQIQVVPTDEIQMLGVPLGSDGKAAAYVEKKLLGKLAGVQQAR